MKLLVSAVVAATLLTTGVASAASLDFVKEAAGNERGLVSGSSLVIDGLAVQFDANNGYFAYLDDRSGGKPGGLGVCKVINAKKQCTPSNDDNLSAGEMVTLTFGKRFDLSDMTFHNANHNSLANSAKTLMIGVNGVAPTALSFKQAVASVFEGVKSITFSYGTSNASQYYLSSVTATPVPVPAAAPLLIGALSALGFAARRRKAAA